MIWRFIRELVGDFLEYIACLARARKEEKQKEEDRKSRQHIIDWVVDQLVDYIIQDWYISTKQTDPKLKTREGVKQHIRWWSSARKRGAFFYYNNLYMSNKLPEPLCDEFAKKFSKVCIVFVRNYYDPVWEGVRDKIVKELF